MGVSIQLEQNEYIACERRHIFSFNEPKDWISCFRRGWYYYYGVIKTTSARKLDI